MNYKIGQRFRLWDHWNSDTYLLCRTGKNMLGLINLASGVSWDKGVAYDDVKGITEDNMLELTGENNWKEIFTLVN